MTPELRRSAATAAVAVAASAAITGLAIGAYERLIREPRTPRFAAVDLTRIVQAGKAKLESAVVRSGATDEEKRAAVEAAAGFNDRMRAALEQLAADCGCTLVGLPMVIGSQPTIPDYTAVVMQRMGL
jgi:hypothetical protein